MGKFLFVLFQVSLCFQRIAAEILGVKLTKPDIEKHHKVVKAEIIQYNNDQAAAKSIPASSQKSSFCSLQ